MRVLYFDYPSLPAAVAVLRAQRAVARHAPAPIPLAFGGFDTLGLDVAVPVTLDQRAEFDAWSGRARDAGLDVALPTRRPATTIAHVIGDLADESGCGSAWRAATFEAYWQHDADLGDTDVLIRLAGVVGIDPSAVVTTVADHGRSQRVRRRMIAARQRGIGGVPVLDIDGVVISADLDDTQWDDLLLQS